MSTSIAVHAPMAASSSSTGEKSAESAVPTVIVPPRALVTVTAKPISLEVFTDDLVDMKRQALKINGWGKNVYTKIPITNARGESCLPLIKELGLRR